MSSNSCMFFWMVCFDKLILFVVCFVKFWKKVFYDLLIFFGFCFYVCCSFFRYIFEVLFRKLFVSFDKGMFFGVVVVVCCNFFFDECNVFVYFVNDEFKF